MVYILLAPGFEEAEALVPADLMRRAGLDVALTALEGELIPGGHQITVKADCSLEQVELECAQAIVLPGGGVGVKNLGEDPRVEALVRQAAERGIRIAAICAAPTLLAQWGLLEGKKALCYPGLEERLTGAVCQTGHWAQDGTILTGKAAGSAFDFGLKLIEQLCGEEKAEEVQHGIHYDGQ